MRSYFIFLTLLSVLNSYAQNFLPMLEEDVVWSVDNFIDPFGGGPSGIVTDDIRVAGETVINNETYKTVYFNDVPTSCLVREAGGIVYRYDANNNTDVVIYDFNLEQGDIFTFPDIMYSGFCAYPDFYNGQLEMNVTDVSTQFIAGENRKVIEFDYYSDSGYFCYWVEGMGSNLGFDPVGDVLDIGYRALACFTKAGVTTFFNDATACDNTTLGVGEPVEPSSLLYPNPVRDLSILEVPQEFFGAQIQVYDITGKIVLNESLQGVHRVFRAMDHPSGLYLYSLVNKKGRKITGRFIIR